MGAKKAAKKEKKKGGDDDGDDPKSMFDGLTAQVDFL